MFESLNVAINPTIYVYPIYLAFIGFAGLIIGLGNKAILFKNHTQLMYKLGKIFIVLAFIGFAYFLPFLLFNITSPIYSVTERL